MDNLAKILMIIGCILLLIAVIVRITSLPINIATSPLKAISFVILANTAFLLAIFFKK